MHTAVCSPTTSYRAITVYSKAHKQFDGTETWKSYAFYAFKDNNSAKTVEKKSHKNAFYLMIHVVVSSNLRWIHTNIDYVYMNIITKAVWFAWEFSIFFLIRINVFSLQFDVLSSFETKFYSMDPVFFHLYHSVFFLKPH